MFTFEPLTSEIAKKAESAETSCDYIKISSGDEFCVMPKKYVDHFLERILNFKVYEDDIWIVTFPKCGTTWTQEMIRMLCNDLNYEKAAQTDLDDVFLFLELSGIFKRVEKDYVSMCEKLPRPRLIKSHLPLFLLPKELWTVKPKIIYVARNPKDVAISFYHHHVNIELCRINKDEFLDAFLSDQIFYSPFKPHALEFWKIRNEPNILFLFYEDMKRDLASVIKETAKFLGKSIYQDQIEELCDHLSFDKIKINPMVNKDAEMKMLKESTGEKYSEEGKFSFIRKGKVGGYKEEFNDKQIKRIDEFSNDKQFEKYGFAHKYF